MTSKIRIAILGSGAGSNARQLLTFFQKHTEIEVGLVVSNKALAGIHSHAAARKVPSVVVSNEQELLKQLQQYKTDWVILAGYLKKIPSEMVAAFPNRILNLHPALLPKFGGKGMYGLHVHKAVVEAKEKESGITIHYVNEQYDEGAIAFQATCKVEDTDTPELVQQKVQALEHSHFAEIIEREILK
jgi:phosphoribosylglycinamide formyltransferase-1